MNSLEALYLLMANQKKVRDGFKFIDLNTHEEVSIEDCYDIVIKDLEILEMLKKNIKLNDCKQDEEEHECALMLILDNEENYKVIKEWLDQ